MHGSLVLIFHTHLPYVLNHGKWPHGSDWLCEAAAECYIPLLNECRQLMDEGIVPNVTFSLSPILVEQLADPAFATLFNDYLDEKIVSAEDDRAYFAARRNERHYMPLADYWHEWYRQRRDDFNHRYRADLVGAFRSLMEEGAIDLQTCAATHGYFPLLGRDSSIDAQLAVAATNFERHFGKRPRGVWMPECAYRPSGFWAPPVPTLDAPATTRAGVEQLLARRGFEYTVVDSHLTRGGHPVGLYTDRFEGTRSMPGQGARYLPLDDSRSIHDLYMVASSDDPGTSSVAIFTRDAETTLRVWSGAYGYPGDPAYLEFHKKHHNSGHRYWQVTDSAIDLSMKTVYRPDRVDDRIRAQARHFVSIVEARLAGYAAATGREGVLTAPFDTELFGHWWFEGPRFLGEVLRCLKRTNVRARTAPAQLDATRPDTAIAIPEGSWGDGGGHSVWLNDATEWTWPKIYRAEARFESLLAELRVGVHGDEDRVLRQMARELLLLQASDWQFLITTASAADYAADRFNEHYDNLMRLAEYAEARLRGAPVSLAETENLARLETVNRPFPELDPVYWRSMSLLRQQGVDAYV